MTTATAATTTAAAAVTTDNYTCTGSTDEQLEAFGEFNFWSDGVVKPLICVIGLLGNSASIPVLLSRAMDSVFNRLLVWLAVCDNAYLFLSIVDCFRKHWGTTLLHKYSFGYVLYGLHNIVMACSIYMTVSLAMERYLAVARPVEYHISVNSGKRWIRIARYVLPVFLFSILFMVPKFYELRPVEILQNRTTTKVAAAAVASAAHNAGADADDDDGDAAVKEVVTDVKIVPTPLRLNQTYSFYYNNAARLLFTGVVPFCLLMAFNYGIYKAVKRRRSAFAATSGGGGARGGGRGSARAVSSASHSSAAAGAAAAAAAASNEETRQAVLLFAIVTFFLFFNTPRNFMNLYEVARFDQIKEDYDHNCGGLPLWVLLVGSASHILLAVNSSMNFFLYCLMSNTFRTELLRMMGRKGDSLGSIRGGGGGGGGGRRGSGGGITNILKPSGNGRTARMQEQRLPSVSGGGGGGGGGDGSKLAEEAL